jgi:hypothetical protein
MTSAGSGATAQLELNGCNLRLERITVKKLAIISDVHRDLFALLDALRLIDKLGCDLIASLEEVNQEQPHDMGLSRREALEFLESRPSSWRARLEGIDVAVHHGSPRSDTAGIRTRGRVHSAGRLGELDVNGLTLGSPQPGGTFGVLELPSLDFSVFRAADGCEMAMPRVTLGIEKASAERVPA